MDDPYEQHLKDLAKSFKNLNVQLLGFLLVAMGFIFTSETILTTPHLWLTTFGLALSFFMWAFALIGFFAIEFYQQGTKISNEELFRKLEGAKNFFGIGFVLLNMSLFYLTTYVVYFLQEEYPERYTIWAPGLLAVGLAILFGWGFFRHLRLPPLPEDSNDAIRGE